VSVRVRDSEHVMSATAAVNQNHPYIDAISASGPFMADLPLEHRIEFAALLFITFQSPSGSNAAKTLDRTCDPTMLPVTCRAVEQPGSSSGS
jgi:hypothetical protein